MNKNFATIVFALGLSASGAHAQDGKGLWSVYDASLKGAKYIDLTHVIAPDIPVWYGFGPSKFARSKAGGDIEGFAKKGDEFTYEKHGFEATHYDLATDQLGTQLDPPAHWAPEYPSIDELPPTYSLRPLAVISIVDKVASNAGYHLQVADIGAFEKEHGRIPEGAVVFVRSDWSKDWPKPELATRKPFPGVSLDALKFLHEQRHILLHGHEPLDTDTTPTLEGEAWLMHNGYTQAEGVANLDGVPATGCLVTIGFPRFKGGTGGYARYVAVCPPDTPVGTTIGASDAPLPKSEKPLHWDAAAGTRVR
ncbi:cyclase family protein [Taklimakanibacter deserti]|uniref:cyclase family protein n=1 Tax=Taklimakanibacter deserti TaxID=2267839 RepID=UPI000E65548B